MMTVTRLLCVSLFALIGMNLLKVAAGFRASGEVTATVQVPIYPVETTGQVMLFRVVATTSPDNSVIPANLTTVDRITNPTRTRVMTLNEQMGMGGPLAAFLNGMPYHHAPATEFPVLGTTEMWEIVNTGDAHPIHLHLVQFQLMNRQNFNLNKYLGAYAAAFGGIVRETDGPPLPYVPIAPGGKYGGNPDVTPWLQGPILRPLPQESGWKDRSFS